MEETNAAVQTRSVSKKSILALFCIAAAIGTFCFWKSVNIRLVPLFVWNLPAALGLGCVYGFAVARESSRRFKQRAFLLIWVSLAAGSFVGGVRQRAEMQRALADVEGQLARISQGVNDPIAEEVSDSSAAKGFAGELGGFMKESLNLFVLQRQEYVRELEAIRWNEILKASRITEDPTFAESHTILKRAREIIARQKEKSDLLLDQTRERIKVLDVPSDYKKGMLDGFDKVYAETKQQNADLWTLEGEIVGEIEMVIQLLSERKDAWRILDGAIQFDKLADANDFNTHLSNIERLGDQQTVIQNKRMESANENLKKMQKAFGDSI